MESLTMQQILDSLAEWKINTDIDIKSDYTTPEERQDYIRQSTQLAGCIGILSTLGNNNNIKLQ